MNKLLKISALLASSAFFAHNGLAQIQAPIIQDLPLVGDLPVGVIAKVPGTEDIALLGTLADLLTLDVLNNPANLAEILSPEALLGESGSLPGLEALPALDALPGLEALPLP